MLINVLINVSKSLCKAITLHLLFHPPLKTSICEVISDKYALYNQPIVIPLCVPCCTAENIKSFC